MTRSYRNNNPGNLEYGDIAKKWGAVPEKGQGRFAWFAHPILGVCALSHALAKYYVNLSLEETIRKYAPAGENNPEDYIKFLEDHVAPRATLIKNLDCLQVIDLIKAITTFEGYKP